MATTKTAGACAQLASDLLNSVTACTTYLRGKPSSRFWSLLLKSSRRNNRLPSRLPRPCHHSPFLLQRFHEPLNLPMRLGRRSSST